MPTCPRWDIKWYLSVHLSYNHTSHNNLKMLPPNFVELGELLRFFPVPERQLFFYFFFLLSFAKFTSTRPLFIFQVIITKIWTIDKAHVGLLQDDHVKNSIMH